MSGLSCGVLVVEAPEKSGALITARLAADQGRDVFVVPGNIDVDSCKGSNALLRDGAIAVSSGWDVVSEYEAQFPGKIRKNTRPAQQAAYPDEVEAAGAESEKSVLKVAQNPKTPEKKSLRTLFVKKKEVDNMMVASYIDAEASLPDLSPEENKLVMLLRQEIELVDDLIAAAQMPAGQVLAVLTMLEIKGVVTRLPGKRVTLKK
jgi:DNA processing protein